MHNKRLLTIDDLYNYYVNQGKNYHFNSSEEQTNLVVQVPSTIQFKKSEKDLEGLMPVTLWSCHTDKNLNGSSISEKSMKAALPSFSNRPILGFIHEVDGEPEFYTHNMHVGEDDEIVYDEIPVGIIPESGNPHFEVNEDNGKTYVVVDGYIFEDYTKAAEILRRKGEAPVSVELSIRDLSYDATEKVLNIEDFWFSGVTILGIDEDGEKIDPGMAGSHINISDFSKEENSMFSHNAKLIESLDRLSEQLANFNINPAHSGELKEGGNLVNKFEELLEKYNKTADEIEFDYEGLTDEELEAKFSEVFDIPESTSEQFDGDDPGEDTEGGDDQDGDDQDDDDQDGDGKEETPEPTEDDIAAADAVTDAIEALTDDSGLDEVQAAADAYDELTDLQKSLVETETVAALDVQVSRAANIRSEDEVEPTRQNNALEYAVTFNGVTKSNYATLNEQLEALFMLVNDTYGEADNEWYSVDADPDKKIVYMHGWNNHYRQNYKVKSDVFTLVGDRVQVFATWLTSDEKKELENLKSNYSAIETELNEYKENELHAQREAVFASEDYSVLTDDADFKALKEAMDDYSPEELSEKADLIYAKFMKSNYSKFSAKPTETKHTTVVMSSGDNADDKKRKPYGGIFENYFKNKGKK